MIITLLNYLDNVPSIFSRNSVFHNRFFAPVALIVITIVIRFPTFGDPNYHVDEGFYLLVGKFMHEGLLPYVDIWDRKPLGLFLLYAGIAYLGGSGFVQYQLLSTFFVFLTSYIIFLISGRISNKIAGLLSAFTYVATIEVLAGGGGQAPVFYNLFMVLSVFLVLKAYDTPEEKYLIILNFVAMTLCGISIFIKQTAVVESCFVGIVFMILQWRRFGITWKLAIVTFLSIVVGLLPTAMGFFYYVNIGHGQEYYFANFISIFLKNGAPAWEKIDKLVYLLFHITPLLIISTFGIFRFPWKNERSPDARIIAGWLGAAVGGFLIIPNFYDHYALPLVVPLSVAAAPLFARPGIGVLYSIIPVSWALGLAHYPAIARTERSRTGIEKASSIIRDNLKGGCLYIFDGPPILYDTTKSCLPTSRVFPEHMNFQAESDATGIDTRREMLRILASRPSVIVKATKIVVNQPNWSTRGILIRELAQNYSLIAKIRVEDFAIPRTLEVWVRTPSLEISKHGYTPISHL